MPSLPFWGRSVQGLSSLSRAKAPLSFSENFLKSHMSVAKLMWKSPSLLLEAAAEGGRGWKDQFADHQKECLCEETSFHLALQSLRLSTAHAQRFLMPLFPGAPTAFCEPRRSSGVLVPAICYVKLCSAVVGLEVFLEPKAEESTHSIIVNFRNPRAIRKFRSAPNTPARGFDGQQFHHWELRGLVFIIGGFVSAWPPQLRGNVSCVFERGSCSLAPCSSV